MAAIDTTGSGFGPKLRSRKDGAAVALDDMDKRLLNLMQGKFPIAPRPYQHVASQAGIAEEEEVLTRVQRLLDERIIRQVTPIYDTRAFGYSSMLVAAKVDPENPWRSANIINEHPGVSHNYLRNHEFNIWFTIATEPDSPLGLEGTLQKLAALAGAESIRQLPTLKLFKIRMDLEMEADTATLSTPVAEAVPPAETDPQPYDEFDRAVVRATQGDLPVISEPFGPAAAELGISQHELLAHLSGMQERRLLRRVAAILYHRRAGFSANGMGVWKVPDDQILEIGGRMATFRGISHCYQRPTYEDWPYSVFTMAHGRSKEECDAILDSIAEQTGIHDRSTLYSSTEFKKIRLLYFTDDFRDWERKNAGVEKLSATDGFSTAGSADLYERALRVLPGGVNSPVRAMRSIGRDPIFIASGSGATLVDVDGNDYVDWVSSWGPLILGHAHPAVVQAVTEAAVRGTSYGAPTPGEVELAEEIVARMPSVEMVRMTSSGTEATMSALRLARAATGRDKILKIAGAYHGHVDGLLAQAGSGLATQGIPASPGVPAAAAAATVIVPWNDLAPLPNFDDIAAVIVEPIPANMGVVPPFDGFLAALRRMCDADGTLLIFDEVITGFRVARGGAQDLYDVLPDLTIMGKIVGGGLPAAAYGGRRELMERIAPAGDVYQAGTLSGNPLAVAAALATFEQLDADAYAQLAATTETMAGGMRQAAADAGVAVSVQSVPGLFTVFFTAAPPISNYAAPFSVNNYAAAEACDTAAYGAWCRALLARGVYPPPSQFEAWFPSLAHDDLAVAQTLEAAAEAFAEVAVR